MSIAVCSCDEQLPALLNSDESFLVEGIASEEAHQKNDVVGIEALLSGAFSTGFDMGSDQETRG